MKTNRLTRLSILFASLAIVLVQCDQFSLHEQFEVESSERQIAALSIAPVAAQLTTSASLKFTATGGIPPYSFSVVSGAGTIDADDGRYTAPPADSTDVVRVTDAAGDTQDAEVAVTAADAVSISPSNVSLAIDSTITFAAAGGSDPYTFSIVSGGGTIDSGTGVYTAPSVADTVTVRVTDSGSPPGLDEATVTVNAPAPDPDPLSISPSSIVLGTDGGVEFSAHGGVAPYAFSIVSGGGSIDPDTGVYTAPSVADTVTVRVTDSGSPPGLDEATVTVNAPASGPLSISPTSISLFTNSIVDFGSAGGVPPYSFSIVAGSGSIDPSTGVFTAPSTAGTSSIRVTDSAVPSAQADATVVVYEPLRIVPESASISAGGSLSFSATGGKTPYTFSVASGGGSIDATSGAYTAPAGPGSVVVRVTDDLGSTRDAPVTITAVQPLVISPSSATLLVGESHTFTVSGGTSPYTFSVRAPAAGLIDSATGEYTAPAFPATDTIRVIDALNNTSDATATVVGSGPLSISPDVASVPVNGQRTFSATGGAPPYSFAVQSGEGSINGSTGVYNAPAFTDTVTVRVTDSLLNVDDATVTVAGAGCGLSLSETEPNDDTGPPWSTVDETGIVLVPGCSVTITGATDADGDPDVFRFEPGTANFVTFIATWSSGDNEIDFELYTQSGSTIAESDTSNADSESMTWAVDTGGPPNRYLAIEVQESGGVNYTLVISAE